MDAESAAIHTGGRIPWVDVAKGIGIALVFYGHLAERFIYVGVPVAETQMKWVYSFHIPLFFLLSGFVYKRREMRLTVFVKRQVLTRLVPVWVFNVASMLAWIRGEFVRPDYGYIGEHGWAALAWRCASETFGMVVQGRAAWNIVTWFVICLFTVELWQFCLAPLLRRRRHLVVSIVCFGVLTVLVHVYSAPIRAALGGMRYWWYVSPALAAMVFYQLGILLRGLGWLHGGGSLARRCGLAALCLVVTLATFDRNTTLTRDPVPVVLMVSAQYGDIGWFALTSVAGSLLVIYVSQVLAGSRVLRRVGQITLVLLCLDGILHDYVNPQLARWTMTWLSVGSVYLFTAVCALFTVASIAVCLPVQAILLKYCPFALGRARGGTTKRPPAG